MKYCSACGATVSHKVPEGDRLPRFVCDHCGEIHYINPKLVVGTVPVWEDKILLCRRAIEPRYGLWTLPAGFMEQGESTAEAASRETREEACAPVRLVSLFSMVNIPHISQVHLFYRADMDAPEFAPGDETLETRLFAESDIPWDELAFRSVSLTLQLYLEDRRRNQFGFHEATLPPKDPS